MQAYKKKVRKTDTDRRTNGWTDRRTECKPLLPLGCAGWGLIKDLFGKGLIKVRLYISCTEIMKLLCLKKIRPKGPYIAISWSFFPTISCQGQSSEILFTLFSFPRADIKSAHSLVESKLFRAFSTCVI